MASHEYHHVEGMQYFRQTTCTGSCCAHPNEGQNTTSAITAPVQARAPTSGSGSSPPPPVAAGALIAPVAAGAPPTPSSTSAPTTIHCGAIVLGLPTTPPASDGGSSHINQHGCCACVTSPCNAVLRGPPLHVGPTTPRILPATATTAVSDAERIGSIKRIE